MIGEADAVLVTVAAPTKPNRRPGRRHLQWRHTRSVVVTLDLVFRSYAAAAAQARA
jgi:hypothetical protein